MYPILKNILFQLPPEKAHSISLNALKILEQLGISKLLFPKILQPKTIMGIDFPNPIGLAAGLDKNGDFCDALSALGFGFIEIGTITPQPQAGNAKPRLFRLIKDEALINRMGFNNKGVAYAVKKMQQRKLNSILGINIGKNKDTPNAKAYLDYVYCFEHLWPYAHYITINISSPNTPNLRALQDENLLTELLDVMKQKQTELAAKQHKYVPLVVKISPDLSSEALHKICELLLQHQIDGVIATNTTITRDKLVDKHYHHENGGLSGAPLCERSTQVIAHMHNILQNKIPIIASGGVMDVQTATQKLQAGAKILQIYTGFIYKGPALIKELAAIKNYL